MYVKQLVILQTLMMRQLDSMIAERNFNVFRGSVDRLTASFDFSIIRISVSNICCVYRCPGYYVIIKRVNTYFVYLAIYSA